MQFLKMIGAVLICFLNLNLFVCSQSDEQLILTPLIESGKLKEARRLSRVRGNQFDCKTEGFSGFLTVDKEFDSNLFFWFFESKKQNAPILLWLQGGPGYASLNSLFYEIGPFEITKNLKLKCRKYAWTKEFSMLFIDSPVGAGFSYTKSELGYARNLENATNNVYSALKQFFTLFSEMKTKDFYATGESYAGKFVSALAYKIHTSNESFLNFKGIALGNAILDPVSSLSYGPNLFQKGLIDEKQKEVFDKNEKEIQSLIEKEDFENAFYQFDKLIPKLLFSGKSVFETFTGYRYPLDLRYSLDPPGTYANLVEFINLPSTRKAIHVGNVSYVLGAKNEAILKPMAADILRSVKTYLKEIMENYKVLLFEGNMDLLVPGVLGYKFLNTLEWKNLDKYLNATRQIWKVSPDDKEIAGYIKNTAGTFWQVTVRNAGHTPPPFQPRAVYDLITKFVNDLL